MDFDTGISVLNTLQDQVATSNMHKNILSEDVTGKMLHIVRNVFEKGSVGANYSLVLLLLI
jgi:hypothetical protein